MVHECNQELTIGLLKKDNETMAKDINEIKGDVSDIKDDITLIKEHILTAPQKYPSRSEFNKHKQDNMNFRNGINLKIATISWGFAVIIFILNKFL